MLNILKIGNVQIPMFPTCIATGIIIGLIYLLIYFKKSKIKLNPFRFIFIVYITLIVFLLGAMVWDFIVHYLRGDKSSGISILGGVIAGIPTLYIVSLFFYKDKRCARILLNAFIPVLIIGQSFGRLGCLCGGCCFGKPTTLPIGIVYPENSLAAKTYGYGTALFPSPLIESIYMFILFLIIIFIKNHRFIIYAYAYSIYRFIIEYFRGDNRGAYILNLSPAQFLSLCLIIFATGLLIYQHIRKDDGKIDESIHYLDYKLKRRRKRKYRNQVN